MDTWGAERADELAALVTAAMPAEGLTADELVTCCWDDPGVVIATSDGTGAVSATVRRAPGLVAASVKLLAVAPGARRSGLGRSLLAAAEAWAWDEGATDVSLGGSAPFYLWPGVDVNALAMSCLAEEAGYRDRGAALNMSVPATFRAETPGGVVVDRALDEAPVVAVERLVAAHWPEWSAEAAAALAQGTCFAAFDPRGRAIGFACHSVNRAGWFGPTGTDPARRGEGIGSALLSEVCRDLMVAGFADVEICWIGPIRFYAAAGGSVSRVFRLLGRSKP